MTTQLIVNADDFGLTPGVNRAIAELHDAGALSSATLMAASLAFGEAVTLALERPSLGVGCHVVLTDGAPLSPPSAIPSLLEPGTHRLRPSLAAFARAALTGKLQEPEIEREAEAQISRLLAAGIRPTHLDTHKHTHLFPVVLRPLLRVAARLGIPAIRNPFEPAWTRNLGQGSLLRRTQIAILSRLEPAFHRELAAHAIHTTRGTVGVSATGSLTQASLQRLLHSLPPTGTWELVCHPGYNDQDLDRITTRLRTERDTERTALLALLPPALTPPSAPRLVSFAALAPSGTQPTTTHSEIPQ